MGREAELLERLRYDTPFYAENALKIVDKRANLVPLVARPWQLRLDAALEGQRKAGLPMRAIILKSRKTGISTWVQGKIIQKITQFPHRKALVVAQDNKTAGELFEIGRTMYRNIGTDPDVGRELIELGLKPVLLSQKIAQGGEKFLKFGEPSGDHEPDEPVIALDSTLEISTSKEVESGRGFTWYYVHISEVAFFGDTGKLTAILNAVPYEPGTMVVLESTANGQNHFKRRWERAEAGRSRYVPVFVGFTEDVDCRMAFANDAEREEFIETIGEGPWGEDEPRLVEEFGCTPEQLNWRRYTIEDQCDSDLLVFKQEYPADPEEAFISSGRQTFSQVLVARVLDRTKRTDPALPSEEAPGPSLGVLTPSGVQTRRSRRGPVEVPTGALWVPQKATGFAASHPFWRVWEEPFDGDGDEIPPEERRPPGQYVIAVDPASGEESESGKLAEHAIEVINHRTLEQVAEYASREDPDEVAYQALLVALYFARGGHWPWLAVEKTGGYGLSILRKLWIDFRYRGVYFRQKLDDRRERQEDRLGWDTNRQSKPLLEDGMRELLREAKDGIRSRVLAQQLTTYVRDEKGRTKPEPDAFADRLLAYMIAQEVAREKPLAALRRRSGNVSTWTNPIRSERGGY